MAVSGVTVTRESVLVCHLPSHDNLSSDRVSPVWQRHRKLPAVLSQICSQPPLRSLHSFMSGKTTREVVRARVETPWF